MKHPGLFFTLLFLFITLKYSAQSDTIRFKDNSIIAANILELDGKIVKYKRADNPGGPSYVIPLTEVSYIVYKNGRKENFNTVAEQKPVERPAEKPADAAQKRMISAAKQKRYAGPRVGVTYLMEGSAAEYILDKGKTPIVSQFGWQFETRIMTTNSGISGLLEFQGLIGGMEQGMFLPSGSIMISMRGRNGIELAAGPVLSGVGLGVNIALTGSFKIDDMLIPVSLAFVPSVTKEVTEYSLSGTPHSVIEQTGHRISLLIGFSAIRD